MIQHVKNDFLSLYYDISMKFPYLWTFNGNKIPIEIHKHTLMGE